MRLVKTLVILILSSMFVTSCSTHYDQNPYAQEVKTFYTSPHNLRKMITRDDHVKESSFGGAFFLFMGGIGGQSAEYTITNVQFAWEIRNDEYVISTFPIAKVRVRINSQTEIPTASFFLEEEVINKKFHNLVDSPMLDYDTGKAWVDNSELNLLRNIDDSPRFLSENMGYLKYLVITCRSSDWPQDISLPLNKPTSEQAKVVQ